MIYAFNRNEKNLRNGRFFTAGAQLITSTGFELVFILKVTVTSYRI